MVEIIRVTETSADAAIAALDPVLPGFTFGATSDAPMEFSLEVHAAHGMTWVDALISGLELETAADVDGFAVGQVTLRGSLMVGRDTLDVSDGRPYAVPHHGLRSVSDGQHSTLLQLDTDEVRKFVHVDLGSDLHEVRSIGHRPFSDEAGRVWAATAAYFEDRLRDGTADDPLIGKALSDLLIRVYLRSFPTTWTELQHPVDGSRQVTAAVRRAVQFIDDNRDQPIGLAEIAQAARLSIRGLQHAFRRQLDRTPLEHLRSARLAAARHDLIEADSADTTVESVARRWGFAHMGRFAQAYRETFGETPSATLRR